MTGWGCEFPKHLLRCDGKVAIAAELCGVSARMVYKRRQRDPEFAAAWVQAEKQLHRLRQTSRHRKAAVLAAMLSGEAVPGCIGEARYTLRVMTEEYDS